MYVTTFCFVGIFNNSFYLYFNDPTTYHQLKATLKTQVYGKQNAIKTTPIASAVFSFSIGLTMDSFMLVKTALVP